MLVISYLAHGIQFLHLSSNQFPCARSEPREEPCTDPVLILTFSVAKHNTKNTTQTKWFTSAAIKYTLCSKAEESQEKEKCIPWRRRQKDRKEDSQPARQIDRKLERNRGTDQEKKNNVKYKKYYKVRLGKSEDSS